MGGLWYRCTLVCVKAKSEKSGEHTGLVGSLIDEVVVLVHAEVLVKSAVVAVEVEIILCNVDPTTWFGSSVCLPQEEVPILDSPIEIPNMDQVEVVLGPCPLLFGVIDLKLNVWWDP